MKKAFICLGLAMMLLVGCATIDNSSSVIGNNSSISINSINNSSIASIVSNISFGSNVSNTSNGSNGSSKSNASSSGKSNNSNESYSGTGTENLDFYVLNDLHGSVEYASSTYELGLTRMATYFKQKRTLNPNGTIVLSNGDMFQGSADSNLTKGKLVTEAFNLMDFDAASIGNHEFDWGVQTIRDNIEIAEFPFLAANIYNKATNTISDIGDGPYTMIERKGVKVGIIGTIGEKQASSILASMVADYKFMPQTTIVNKCADELRAQGADVVILLAHETFTDYNSNSDFRKLLCVDGTCSTSKVDAIFSAHEHALHNEVVNGVPIIQARSNGRALAHLALTYDKQSKKVTITENEIEESLTALNLAEDTAMKELYQYYLDNYISAVKNEVVGNLVGNFNRNGIQNSNGLPAFGQFVADVMQKYGLASHSAGIALHNAGGIRADLRPTNGKITYGDIYKSFPFDNELMVMNVKGSNLGSIMRNHYSSSSPSPYAGINLTGTHLSNGTAISTTAVYRVLTINYLSEQPTYYPSESVEHTYAYVRDLIVAEFRLQGTIYVDSYMY